MSQTTLPALTSAELPDDFRDPRIVTLEAKKTLTKAEREELDVLRMEEFNAQAAEQFILTMPTLKIISSSAMFEASGQEVAFKKIQGILLYARLARVFWPSDDMKKEYAKQLENCVGPMCSSLNLRQGALFDVETGERQATHCSTCPYNADNRDEHPDTAGMCKLQQRALFLPVIEGKWARMPWLFSIPSSSVKAVSAFYSPRQYEGIQPYQVPVELSLEKKEIPGMTWSVLRIEQVGARIDDFGVRRTLLGYLNRFREALGLAPVTDREAPAEVVSE